MNEFMDKISAWQIASEAMMNHSILPLCTMLACTVSVLGCIGPEGTDDDTESLATTQEAALTSNALTSNALTSNALTSNALTSNALTSNALTSNALTSNALTSNALTSNGLADPNAREVFKYIVSCALPSTSSVDLTIGGVDYSFQGELGLAPKWGAVGGQCNTACQEWVSACVMARVDFLGEKVSISVRGAQSALVPSPTELAAYTYREGAYYGNIFLTTPVRDACIAPGRTGLPRVCGPSLDGCVVDAIGGCGTVCQGSAGFGSFMGCADHAKVNGQFPVGTHFYPTAVTVLLDP
jgi:hypothetical protein